MKAEEIATKTRSDAVLKKAVDYTMKGWPTKLKNEERDQLPFFQRRLELTVRDGCLLWGSRVVVPEELRSRLLDQLHVGHPGSARMKSLARSLCYWPNIDAELETKAKTCQGCALASGDPRKQPLKQWKTPEEPWERIHADFAGPFHGAMWLIVVDALSGWPEVEKMKSTTTEKTQEALMKIFTPHGLPTTLVTDNGPQFTSREFKLFCEKRGIEHILTPPYHPQSNGKAERFVQTFKKAMDKATANERTIDSALRSFLVRYRITPHATTEKAPCELMMKRKLRMTLDLVRPTVEKQKKRQEDNFNRGKRAKNYEEGSDVWTKNTSQFGERWLKGVIEEKLGSVVVKVRAEDGRLLRRHKNQIRERLEVAPAPPLPPPDVPAEEPPRVATPSLAERRTRRPAQPPKRLVDEM